jgi:hypothetical protein
MFGVTQPECIFYAAVPTRKPRVLVGLFVFLEEKMTSTRYKGEELMWQGRTRGEYSPITIT